MVEKQKSFENEDDKNNQDNLWRENGIFQLNSNRSKCVANKEAP